MARMDVPCWYTLSGPTQHTMLIRFLLELVTEMQWERAEGEGEVKAETWIGSGSG